MIERIKRQSHDQGIKKPGLLQNQLTPVDNRSEIVQDNFCEQVLRGRKNTSLDVSMCSFLRLWMSMKEVPELL
jgi:hypothetical protein